MAKKNSSKTATEKALTAANPRIQVFNKWAGVNFKDAPLGWEYEEPNKFYAHHQTDLPLNNFVIQNNLVTDMSDTVSTRNDSEVLTTPNENYVFTGVTYLYRHWLFSVQRYTISNEGDSVWYKDICDKSDTWHRIIRKQRSDYGQPTDDNARVLITEIGSYEDQLIVLTQRQGNPTEAVVYTGSLSYDESSDAISGEVVESNGSPGVILAECYINNPGGQFYAPILHQHGFEADEWYVGEVPPEEVWKDGEMVPFKGVNRYTFVYSFKNKWGTTTSSASSTIWLSVTPYELTSSRYVSIAWPVPNIGLPAGVTGVDVWVNVNENQNYTLATSTGRSSGVNWYGAMTDVDTFKNGSHTFPQENTTLGPNARHFEHIDSRLYWWGDPNKPYRLLIGGNIGNEFSIARSNGGGWIDIEPGSGYVIQGVCKWKTAQAANIVTILCGHPNTNQVKRFNLIEMTSTFTNEIIVKGWQYEEVSNVVGCNSRWGFGVFADGLYTVDRYGLMLTTMAAEYNNQMRNMKVSENIDPIFTERLGHRLNDARLVHIDGVIYIILSEDNSEDEPQNLDRVILCYDIGKKAWYTFTHDGNDGLLLHAIPIDSERHVEGLGIISEHAVTLYPTTGIQECSRPDFNILLETGELCSRIPMQAPYYVEQLEFRFDYFIGNCDCLIEGVDYYGRKFTIIKQFGKSVKACGGVDEEKRMYSEWVRVQKLVEFMRITIKGPARFRMTHIINKAYLYNNLIGMPYGFDAQDTFINRAGQEESIHHYIKDYNNLRRAIVS